MNPRSAMPRRALGKTGLEVSVLGLGTAPLGDLYTRLDDATAIAAAARAFELGINLLDTSPLYGHGLSEHRCGTVLRRLPRQEIVVCTKVGRWMDPFHGPGNGSGFAGGQPHRAVVDYSYDGTMRSVEQSLLRLGTDRLDLILIHDVDVWTHGNDAIEERFREAMEGAYVALDRLRAEGVVAGIGVGVNEAEMCVRFAQAGSFDTMLLAGRYSLLEQPALAQFLPLAERQGIGVLLGGVFNSGILATGAVRARNTIIRTHHLTSWQRWPISNASAMPMAWPCQLRRCISRLAIRPWSALCWERKARRRSSATSPLSPVRCLQRFGPT